MLPATAQLASQGKKAFSAVTLAFTCLLGGTLLGILLGGLGGLGLGFLLARGYTKRGPSDLADGPAYVGLGLIFLGAGIGAVAGLIAGIVMCLIHWAGRLDESAYQRRISQSAE